MATLILTAVGGALAGPFGAAIGALAGQYADNALIFRQPNRQGPRLTELALQTSSYGTQIPKLFGTMRVAGTVIWSTDLIESSQTSHAKGQPSTTTYSYSASFAVLLSARPILSIGRIWGGRQPAARRGRRFQDADRVPAPFRRRGPGGGPPDRIGGGRADPGARRDRADDADDHGR